MIGIIGPADSTALALAVAADDGYPDEVVGRSYRSVEESPRLARELDELCHVLLFTGRIPYAIARARGGLRASLHYVPHSGADLYRALAQLQHRHGSLPAISLDTIEPEVVAEAYADLGAATAPDVLGLAPLEDPEGIRPEADIVAFHRERHLTGAVSLCVTCVGSVHRRLEAEGIPTWRISHSRTVLREALRAARLASRLAITEASQPAAVLVRMTGGGPDAPVGSYEAQRRRLLARMAVLDMAQSLQGRMTELDDETLMVHTNRATVEGAVARVAERNGPLAIARPDLAFAMGIGIGATVPAAEENARRALVLGERYGALHVAAPDGGVVVATDSVAASEVRLGETDPDTLRLAERLGLGPAAFSRLLRTLRQIDTSAVTGAELARAHGVEPRSGRRIMTRLADAGIAVRLGVRAGVGAGRPQTVYRIDIDRLLPGAGSAID